VRIPILGKILPFRKRLSLLDLLDNRCGVEYTIEAFRHGKLYAREVSHNALTIQGCTHIVNVITHGTTAIGTWYVVLFESNSPIDLAWTYATHSYTEFDGYSDVGGRPAFNESAAAQYGSTGAYCNNSANKAVFTVSDASNTLYGACLVGGGSAPSTKNDTAGGGTLLSATRFGSSMPVDNTTILNITCEFRIVSGSM
jgi:hypothetical protein